GPEHPDTLMSMSDLGHVLGKEGHYASAEKLLRQTVEIQRRVLGPDHADTAASTYKLACLAARQDELDKALSLLREAVDHGLDQPPLRGREADSDPRRLQEDPRFKALITYARERTTAVKSQ